ncbi:MAG: hypothetical protein GF320_14440, partial [Armatimonadia bacterium]|nr:hypothetical protein [Armatimonadia bacterium]
MRLWALLAALMAMPAACQQTIEDLPDPFVGDYRGTVQTTHGEEPIFAEIICWGDEGYQANLLPTLEERCDPHAVVRGSVVDGVLTFEDGSAVEDGVFAGAVDAGDFEMARFLELSPTLGAEAPTGAVVLFDGTDLEQWHLGGARPWRVNLAEALGGGPDQVAYLAARIHAPEDIPSAVLEIGSDDGVKAWLNGEVVHDNNTHRPISDFEDQVQISLHEGWNALLLKVTQNVGGWEASARISADDEGTPLQ